MPTQPWRPAHPFRLSLWLGYLALIAWLSLIPGDQMPVSMWDKAAHTLAYAGMSGLAAFTLTRHTSVVISLPLLLGYSIALEVLQDSTGYRHMSANDVLANGLGLGLGYAIALIAGHLPLLQGLVRWAIPMHRPRPGRTDQFA